MRPKHIRHRKNSLCPAMSRILKHELAACGQKVPIIFITAHESMRRLVLEQGAVACLSKPFSDEALLQALNTVFGAH
jgi:FixJ family two-component response regulator